MYKYILEEKGRSLFPGTLLSIFDSEYEVKQYLKNHAEAGKYIVYRVAEQTEINVEVSRKVFENKEVEV